MSTSQATVLKTTEDLKHFERHMADSYRWSGKVKMHKVNLGKLLSLDNQGDWLWPDVLVPATADHIPSDLIPKVNKYYVFDDRKMRRIVAGIMLRKPIMLIGPQGCGKSTLFEQFYARMRMPAVRVQCTSSMDTDYLFGWSTLSEQNGASISNFKHGIVSGTRKYHVNVMLDEVTHLSEMVSPDLNTFLEMKSDLRVSSDGFELEGHHKSQVVEATPFQDVWMSSNTGGREESDSGFTGNSSLNTATMDRCLMVDTDYLTPELEKKVFEKIQNGKDWIDPTVQFMNLVRESYKAGDITKSLSTRSGLDFLEYLGFVKNIGVALGDTILAKYERSERQTVLDFFETAFGIEPEISDLLIQEF